MKEKNHQGKEFEELTNRQKRNFESYEDGIITKEEFMERKEEISRQLSK